MGVILILISQIIVDIAITIVVVKTKSGLSYGWNYLGFAVVAELLLSKKGKSRVGGINRGIWRKSRGKALKDVPQKTSFINIKKGGGYETM